MGNQVQYISPEGMHSNPAFSQVVVTQGSGKTIYVGGQNGVDASGAITGKGDIAAQTTQALKNLQMALAACGATFDNIVKMTIYMVQGQDLMAGFGASQQMMQGIANAPAISVVIVAGLANPGYLVEIEAIAFLPEQQA